MADLHETFVCIHAHEPELITWTYRTRLPLLSDEQLNAAYTRAHDFISTNKVKLLQKHGWKELRPEDDELFFIFTRDAVSPSEFALPTTFSSLRSNAHTYLSNFTAHRQRPSQIPNDTDTDTNTDYSLTAPTPLSNIFHMLQCIAPGMLQLVGTDTLADGITTQQHARALPTASWVSQHRESLTAVRGSAAAYQDLLDAARDGARSSSTLFVYPEEPEEDDLPAVPQDVYHPEGTGAHHDVAGRSKYGGADDVVGDSPYAWTPPEGYDEDWDDMLQADDVEDRSLDYTACGLECGYCGHCDYNDPNDEEE